MFIIGKSYQRFELLNFIGSKQPQSGILWNKEGSDVIIVTTGGRHTKRVSYTDARRPDGTWIYTGQGESGDQNPDTYANSLLRDPNKKILFFTTREPTAVEVRERGNHQKLYMFEGIFRSSSWRFEVQYEGKRKGDKLLKFILTHENEFIEEVYLPLQDPLHIFTNDLLKFNDFRSALKSKKALPETGFFSSLIRYNRSMLVKQYALLRAKGKCECCENEAPFLTISGIPFLEVHHIYSLSDNGLDNPINVAALCPNCHREAHYGQNQQSIKNILSLKIQTTEKNLDLIKM